MQFYPKVEANTEFEFERARSEDPCQFTKICWSVGACHVAQSDCHGLAVSRLKTEDPRLYRLSSLD